jgi:hypothetical protein
MYDALAKSIGADASGINTNYDSGIANVKSAFGGALGATKASYDQSRNGVADTLARLGIQEAGANTTAKQSAQQALMQNIISANGLASQNALSEGKQAALTYNTAQKQNAGFVGNEKRAGVKTQLADFLNQIDMKKAELGTQVNQTAMGLQSSAAEQAYKSQQDAQDQAWKQQQFDYQRAKDKADLEYKYASMTGTQGPKLDPLGAVQALATNLYGNSQAAGNAVQAVTDAMSTLQGSYSLADLYAKINERLQHLNNGNGPGDMLKLRQLAAELYDKTH